MNIYDVNKGLSEAIHETKNLLVGETFLVRELFLGYRWNRIPHKDRLLLGILFLNHVNSASAELHAIEKTPSKQQRYRKIKNSSFVPDVIDPTINTIEDKFEVP